jgi:hypothetical protein
MCYTIVNIYMLLSSLLKVPYMHYMLIFYSFGFTCHRMAFIILHKRPRRQHNDQTTVDTNPFADLTVISLATLKERVEEDRSVELLRRREICSAITTVAKWLNMPPEMIPAAMSYLRPRLGRLHQYSSALASAVFKTSGHSYSLPFVLWGSLQSWHLTWPKCLQLGSNFGI